ncbi:MAG: SDR family oxidoreductase [Thiotrichales bacterium]|nr:SDR family oxidoreductase [Thiotrichales bacterium]
MKLITGANGFLGRAVLSVLEERGIPVRGAVRTSVGGHNVAVGDIGPNTDWLSALEGIDTIIHTAARVHVLDDTADDPLAAFRKVNVAGTRRLAEQAAQLGVRRLVFISSIKVNGETTGLGKSCVAFTSFDRPRPEDAYAQSKWEAEQALYEIAAHTDLEVVVIRPPLVYGPGVKANFLSMMCWLYREAPLPFGSVHNKRSMIALDNLVDLIVTCVDHPNAANKIFLASDDDDLSTTELLQRMARALGKTFRLFSVPVWLLKVAAMLIGKRDVAQRLLGSLQVDISNTKEVLDWVPPLTVDQAIVETAEDFLVRNNF